ncbi:TIR domain-containing protein [Amycolatopsis nigrescens]|uniref:TIR domain-containing protein n=1 Tax=Amycolatopsis nigrescens TaxID=381445 RepID=UPI0003717071|nr:TIR domain-containing protein [Amycolatopsis nigrescens]
MRVIISYAHDDLGRVISQSLVAALRQRGVEVLWDRDLPVDNPSSLPEWIANGVAGNPVLCVLSPDYVRRFGRGDTSACRKGVLFESRILLQKIFDHTEADRCPVIPVADPGFSADLAPAVLKNLVIARFDPGTADGVDQIVRRLLALRPLSGPSPGSAPGSVLDPARIQDRGGGLAVRGLREVVCDLEAAAPSSGDDLVLVREWLDVAGNGDVGGTDFVRGFPAVERIIKSAGDAGLMREVCDRCLAALQDTDLSEQEKRMKAVILIRGRAWHLHRRHELQAALQAVHDGIGLAKECDDRWLVALGKGFLGVLHRGLAEDAPCEAREYHLHLAADSTEAAITMFTGMTRAVYEVGVCTKVLAHICFTRYRLSNQRGALRQANKLADRAVGYLTPDRAREYHELLILRAEIAIARGGLTLAWEFVDKAIRSLGQHVADGASYLELLGCAHLARARLRLKEGGPDAAMNAARDAEIALKIFDELKLPYSVAGCRWLLIKLAPETVGVYRGDIKVFERLFPDPLERLLAVGERSRRIEERTGSRWTRQAEWRDIVRKVRHHG